MTDLLLEKNEELARSLALYPPAFPAGQFEMIVSDPPWKYKLRNQDASHRNRCPYPSMSNAEILALPVPQLAAKDCVLWLWVTNNFMDVGLDCVKHWGFTQKTILTWVKVTKKGTPHIGTGHWLRPVTEHCILAVRGKVPCFGAIGAGTMSNEPTVIFSRRREHSQKPPEFYRLAEKLCPNYSKLEMFARSPRKGWTVWGGEVNKFEEYEEMN